MADEKNVTLAQLAEFASKADERLDKLELYKENKFSPVSIVIATEGWASEETNEASEEETTTPYPVHYDIPVEGVTANDRIDIAIDPASMDAAIACGLCTTNETLAGKVRVWAKSVPTAAIAAQYRLNKGKET